MKNQGVNLRLLVDRTSPSLPVGEGWRVVFHLILIVWDMGCNSQQQPTATAAAAPAAAAALTPTLEM